jgi:hypothetical protein
VTRHRLQKTSLKLISVSISDFLIKSKNVTNITNAEYRSHLINTILNSKSLSKEIYNKLSPLEDIEVDSIKDISSIGISKKISNQVFIQFQNSFTTGQSQI